MTSMTDIEAKNHGMDALPPRAERYQKADEFAAVMDKLFLSWEEEAFLHDRDAGSIINPSEIEPIHHKGTHFNVHAPSTTPRSPQGKPVSMQAGASKEGIALATKYADAVYSVSWNLKQAKTFRAKLDHQIQQSENPTKKIKVLPGLVTYVGRTYEEALEKKAALDKRLLIETALKQLSFFTQQDCSNWALDEKVPPLPPVEEFHIPRWPLRNRFRNYTRYRSNSERINRIPKCRWGTPHTYWNAKGHRSSDENMGGSRSS